MKQTMRHADGTNHRPRHVAAAKTAAAGRHAIAAARRTHVGEVRAAVRNQIVESYRRRQEISQALVELAVPIFQLGIGPEKIDLVILIGQVDLFRKGPAGGDRTPLSVFPR